MFKHGRKAALERLAEEIRAGLSLAPGSPFDAFAAAKDLAIPVFSLSELMPILPSEAPVRHLQRTYRSDVSAFTCFTGRRRIIVYNDRNSADRRASDLAHELAHTYLEHEPEWLRDRNGDRHWDGEKEEEASYLAGALLVPRDAALKLIEAGNDVGTASRKLAVSKTMFSYRAKATGALLQAQRKQQMRRTWQQAPSKGGR